MNKKLVALLFAMGFGLTANIASAVAPCPEGTVRKCWYAIVSGNLQVQGCWCQPVVEEESKLRSSIIAPTNPNNGLRITDPNDKESVSKR